MMMTTAGVLSQLLVLLLVCRLTIQRQEEEMAAAAVVDDDDGSRHSKAIWSSNRFQVNNNRLWMPPPVKPARIFMSNNWFMPWGLGYWHTALSMIIPTSTRTVTVVNSTAITVTTTLDNYCVGGPAAASLPCENRKRRGVEYLDEDESSIYINGQRYQPSQVASILATAMPNARNVNEEPLILSTSMDEQQPYESRHFGTNNKYYFVTTVTSILDGVVVSTVPNPTPQSIILYGSCLPACLNQVAKCP